MIECLTRLTCCRQHGGINSHAGAKAPLSTSPMLKIADDARGPGDGHAAEVPILSTGTQQSLCTTRGAGLRLSCQRVQASVWTVRSEGMDVAGDMAGAS